MLSGCSGAATALLDLVAVRGTIQLVWRNLHKEVLMLMILVIVRLEYYTMCTVLVNMLNLLWTKGWLILPVLLLDISKPKETCMDCFWELS
uniref:Uncharacterized protein n=1 Tax=Oryza rufipogon TaxID=4529 RepID=A0A0E0N4W4_ORYRU